MRPSAARSLLVWMSGLLHITTSPRARKAAALAAAAFGTDDAFAARSTRFTF